MVAIDLIATALEARRRELGMTHEALGARSGVSISTVKRALHGADVASSCLSKLHAALGMSLRSQKDCEAEAMLDRQAHQKAERLASITQATSSLESQGLDQPAYERMVREFQRKLRAGSKRNLWSNP